MPASVRKRDGMFRLVEPNGKLVRNMAGTPVDGGGHTNKQQAEKQAAAINRRSK